jgi:hypothetical protein
VKPAERLARAGTPLTEDAADVINGDGKRDAEMTRLPLEGLRARAAPSPCR